MLDELASEGERELTFHHALVQEVAYGRLLRRRRRALHGQVAHAAEALYGNGDDVIDLLRAKGDPARLGADEREIVVYVRQLMRTNRVEQAVFDALLKRHGVQWLLELTAAANYFAMLSGVVNAFEVAAPSDGDKLPASA